VAGISEYDKRVKRWQSHPQQLKLEPIDLLDLVRGRGLDILLDKTESGLLLSYKQKIYPTSIL